MTVEESVGGRGGGLRSCGAALVKSRLRQADDKRIPSCFGWTEKCLGGARGGMLEGSIGGYPRCSSRWSKPW